MGHRRADVVAGALEVLAAQGLPDLTMRQLGAHLEVQPSALYHHFPNKQALLGAVADAIVDAAAPTPRDRGWEERVLGVCREVRRAVLAYPDGADLVATMWAYGLGAVRPYDDLVGVLVDSDVDPALAATAAATLLHFVYGHAFDEQAHSQASRLGAIETAARSDDFEAGLALVVDGVRSHVPARAPG